MTSIEQRYDAKVDRSGGPDACHPWNGGCGQYGQPNVFLSKVGGKSIGITGRRLAWRLAHGEDPPARRVVTVTCGLSRCLNPKHLALRAFNDDATRFWSKVDKSAGPRACWPWMGRRNKHKRSYGVFSVGHHGNRQAHRVAYELTFGPIASVDLFVCHHCDNPPCCNPEHFFLGTAQENNDDMWRKGRGSCGPEHSAIMASRPNARRTTPEQIAEVRRLRAEGLTQAKIAVAVGISSTTVWNVLNRSSEHKGEEKETGR